VYALNRLILMDSYKPGTVQEVRLDGPTNLNGINGAGKTTLLRLIPLFFGESPSRLMPKSRVNESFVQHYLPHDSSYPIFEYRRPRQQTCMAVMYASPGEASLCYRFVDKGYAMEDFLVPDNGGWLPISCRDLKRQLDKKGIFSSNQLSSRNDYRTVIQNLPHARGAEIRQLISRFSFCESAGGRRLQHIEKIVTGMFMRSTDFRDLREMLVSCIEEDQDAITLEVRSDTLHGWNREYRAFLHAESRRETMAELERVGEEAGAVRQELAELAARVRGLIGRAEGEHASAKQDLHGREQERLLAKNRWETLERDLKEEQADLEARLAARRRELQQLEAEKADWERRDIAAKLGLYESRETIRSALSRAREDQRRLLEKVNDIDAEFGRIKAEREKELQQRLFDAASRGQALALEAEREKSRAREDDAERQRALRERAEAAEQDLQQRLQALKEQRGRVSGALNEIQAAPELLAERDAKRQALEDAGTEQDRLRERSETLNAAAARHRQELQHLEQARRHLAERRQRAKDETERLRNQLDADSDTLLGFLREHHPAWTGHIAKLIKPELLLRDDLSPRLTGSEDGFYGVGLALEALTADRAASETELRAALAARTEELDRIALEERKLEQDFAAHRKTAAAQDKERKELDLALAQCRARIKQIRDEAASLERQIEASRRERGRALRERLEAIGEELAAAESELGRERKDSQQALAAQREALKTRLAAIDGEFRERQGQVEREAAGLRQAQLEATAELEARRLASLAKGGVDTAALDDLEKRIKNLERESRQAEQAAEAVEKYQRWRQHEWPRHAPLQKDIAELAEQVRAQQARYAEARSEFERGQTALQSAIAGLEKTLRQLATQLETLSGMAEELARYPRLPEGSVALESAHTPAFLGKQKHELTSRERELQKRMGELVAGLKRALNQFPGPRPASFCERIVQDIGLDAPDRAWLAPLRDWYGDSADELRRWLVMQANTFGSAVRNYQQALARFDRGIDSLSRRLAASIDRNIGFEKIEAIHARLLSNVGELGYWQQIVAFTDLYDQWQRTEDTYLPDQSFADAVQVIAAQLQAEGKVETRLVNLLGLEIAVTENGRQKRAAHDEELRQISSHGLSYLILCVFFVALVNMIRKEQPVTVIWPMDELKDLHQINIERLLTILEANRITLLSAFPDPDPEILRSFKNRYEIYGYRELVEMVVDEEEEVMAASA
jgi:hypothetical protein